MLKPAYSIQKFSENFSKTNTIEQFIDLAKNQKFELEVDFVHRIPSILTWKPADDFFSGEYNLLLYPRLSIDGKRFAPPKMVKIRLPSNIMGLESIFLEALKNAINSVEEVWN